MNKRKIFYIILLIVGLIPLIIPLILGILAAINGTSEGLICLSDCTYYYGFKAFFDIIVLYSYIFWPTYIIGLVLIIISVIKLKHIKKTTKK